MKQYFLLSIVVLVLLFGSGCGTTPEEVETTLATSTPSKILSPPTITPTATFTPTPTITPTPRLPISFGTQLPLSPSSISVENVDQIVELVRWGGGVISGAIFSSDGKILAIPTTLGVSLHNAETLEQKLFIETGRVVISIAFSPDGKYMSGGLLDNAIKIWETENGNLIQNLDDHTDKVWGLAFSPDGSILASASDDKTVKLWQVSDGSLLHTFAEHTKGVRGVLFSPDGQSLFTGSLDGTVRHIQISSREVLRSHSYGQNIIRMNLSTDGNTLAVYEAFGGHIVAWDVETWKEIQKIKFVANSSSQSFSDIALSPDGKKIAVVWENYNLQVYSVEDGTMLKEYTDLQPKGEFNNQSFFIDYSPDGQTLLFAGNDMIALWDMDNGSLLQVARPYSQFVFSFEVSPDGQLLASVEGINVQVRQILDGQLFTNNKEIISVNDVVFSPDGANLLVGGWNGIADMWSFSNTSEHQIYETNSPDDIRTVAIAPDGEVLALGIKDVVELHQISDGALLFSLSAGFPDELAFSPDGKLLACVFGSSDTIALYRVSDGKSLKTFKGGEDVAFSPNSMLLAGADNYKKVNLWDIATGEVLLSLSDHDARIYSIAFSPNGTLLVSADGDGIIKIWNISDGQLLKSWNAHSLRVTDLAFSRDGKQIISSSYDGTIRFWGLKP